ncbi:MAG: hypothetical protein EP330_25880 [Deltaproteobacteria bacterium]|nr:MAG: hypothetical protein EP330_25880 [Deltaproteobacteria bacterium]
MARLASTIPFLCVCLATSAVAGESESESEPTTAEVAASLDARTAGVFADELLLHGDPFNALTFYRLSRTLGAEDAGDIGFRMALCYELGDRFAAAEQAYLDLAGQHADWSARATFRAAMSAQADGRPREAAMHLQDVLLEGQGTELAPRAAYMQGVVALSGGELASADAAFSSFEASYPSHSLVPRAAAARAVLAERIPRRSPALAGAMSLVLPGSGQLYAGHPGDAAMAFLASGVLGLWSYTLVRSGFEDDKGWRVGTGAALGTVAAFTWTSNVFGAVRGARRSNSYLRKKRADEALRETADSALPITAEDVLRDEALFGR